MAARRHSPKDFYQHKQQHVAKTTRKRVTMMLLGNKHNLLTAQPGTQMKVAK